LILYNKFITHENLNRVYCYSLHPPLSSRKVNDENMIK